MKSKFDPDRLPDAYEYFRSRLDKFKIAPHGAKAMACCPFHQDKRPSLAISLTRGGYKCYACGEQGSSMIDFHMKLYGMDFKDAVKDLGAWCE